MKPKHIMTALGAQSDWQTFEEGHVELVRALVKDVSYDGTTGAVSLNLMRKIAAKWAARIRLQ